MEKRYELEPYIESFAEFDLSKDKKILEIGVGLGADHQMFAINRANLWGIDLTKRAIKKTKKRFKIFGLKSNLSVMDAEKTEFTDDFFDIIYSWGVIHHSPNTEKIVNEIYRILKPGCEAKIMIYHKWSIVGYMLWIKYALLKFKPWLPLSYIYSNYLESPGTKAYSIKEAKRLFYKFSDITIETKLTHGDLLESNVGQNHRGIHLKVAKLFWPRKLIKFILKKHGLYMLIKVKKD
tara:strand:+ start:17 stop:724 length:708 start_codon:yes stop_codon:yes gene_type:complete